MVSTPFKKTCRLSNTKYVFPARSDLKGRHKMLTRGGTVATLKIHSHYNSSYTTLRAEFFARQSTPRQCSLCRRAFSFSPLNKELKILIYSYFEKGCREKMCMRQSRKVIWDMINTPFLTL